MKTQKTTTGPQEKPRPDPDAFAFALTRTAVAQICKAAGYASARESALTALTRVVTLYLQALSRAAASRSNASGRTDSNLLDLAAALRDVVLPSAAGLLSSGGVLTDIIQFVDLSEEIPFAKPVPRTRRGVLPCEGDTASSGARDWVSPSNVPEWLPAFPDTTPEEDGPGPGPGGKRRGLWEEEADYPLRVGVVGDKKINGGGLGMERRRLRFKIGGPPGKPASFL